MTYKTLPPDYVLAKTINLQTDKKLALGVNAAAFAVTVIMVLAAIFFIPFNTFVSFKNPENTNLLLLLLLAPAMIIYIITHELIHGIFIRHFSKMKPKYGFTGMYAYAGSTAFFDKKSYRIIALAPVIIWFVILLILNLALPMNAFWFIYIIQIVNLSGAAGDFYVTWLLNSFPEDVLIHDSGFSMEFYCRAQKEDFEE